MGAEFWTIGANGSAESLMGHRANKKLFCDLLQKAFHIAKPLVDLSHAALQGIDSDQQGLHTSRANGIS